MKNIKYYTVPDIKDPAMIACWTGMGNVGLQAADYIRLKLKAALFAEADISDLVSPDAISVDKGLSSITKVPNLSLYFAKKPPLIISVGKEQFYGQAAVITMERLISVAQKFNVKKIFTGAAFPTYMSHRNDSKVYAAANSKALLDYLKEKQNLEAMSDGQISGLNGLILEAAKKQKIEAACLLATLPIYAISFPNPRASKAIIKVLQNILGMDIDMTELELSIHEADKMFQGIEEQLKHLGIEEHKEKEPHKPKSTEIPKKILDRIEGLFEEAKKDKRIAHRLKEELDRWNLFKLYEDRFLDLFRESH